MPFLAVTKGTKRNGLQTFQRAMQLAPPLKEPELAYLDLRDWYVNQLALLAQLQEALVQAKAEHDKGRIDELGKKIHAENSKLIDFKRRARGAGEKSWAEAFHLAAAHMLPKESIKQIEMQADQLLGRPRHELREVE